MAQNKQAALDAVSAAIDALITGGAVQEYSLNGRSIRKFTLQELMNYRSKLQAEVASQTTMRTYAGFQEPPGNAGPGYPQPSGL